MLVESQSGLHFYREYSVAKLQSADSVLEEFRNFTYWQDRGGWYLAVEVVLLSQFVGCTEDEANGSKGLVGHGQVLEGPMTGTLEKYVSF